ncbi:hypothetical protein Tco_0191015 [Tanacetum coccineum]
MSNTNTNLPTQTSSVLQNDTVSSCSISKVQEKTQLLRIKCMNSLQAIQSQLKFLIETLQDFGNMPIFKRTFSQDLDLLENHLTKEIISQTDCKTTLTKLRTRNIVKILSIFQKSKRMLMIADIQTRFNDEEPMAEVQLTAECNIFVIGQQSHDCIYLNLGIVLKNNAKILVQMTWSNHYLDVAKKKIQERDRNSTTSVTTSARFQSTADDSKPKPRSNNQTSRSLPVSKRHWFSPNNTFAVYEKTSPRYDLRWKPTGRIFKYVGHRWIPTGKLFDSCTSKVDSEPPHGSNVDIPNIHECKQTLDVSAGTSINVQKEQSLDLSAGTLCNVNKENLRVWLLKKLISQKPLSKWIHR